MTDYLLGSIHSWGLILGVLSPMLISIVQQPQWSNRTRTAVGVAIAVVIGVLTALAGGSVNPGDWLATIATVLIASQAAYRGIFVPSGVAKVIELKTATGQGPRSRGYDQNAAA